MLICDLMRLTPLNSFLTLKIVLENHERECVVFYQTHLVLTRLFAIIYNILCESRSTTSLKFQILKHDTHFFTAFFVFSHISYTKKTRLIEENHQ